jgi:hypothetical protein
VAGLETRIAALADVGSASSVVERSVFLQETITKAAISPIKRTGIRKVFILK